MRESEKTIVQQPLQLYHSLQNFSMLREDKLQRTARKSRWQAEQRQACWWQTHKRRQASLGTPASQGAPEGRGGTSEPLPVAAWPVAL